MPMLTVIAKLSALAAVLFLLYIAASL